MRCSSSESSASLSESSESSHLAHGDRELARELFAVPVLEPARVAAAGSTSARNGFRSSRASAESRAAPRRARRASRRFRKRGTPVSTCRVEIQHALTHEQQGAAAVGDVQECGAALLDLEQASPRCATLAREYRSRRARRPAASSDRSAASRARPSRSPRTSSCAARRAHAAASRTRR